MLILNPQNVQAATPSLSSACIECHATYCQAWESTRHGRSLLPYTSEHAAALLTPQPEDILIGTHGYRFYSNDQDGWIEERSESIKTQYRITGMLGGKNILVFLTQFEGGRLQILPLAYNIRKKKWFDNTAAALPHGLPQAGAQANWKSPTSTFNTSCFMCHINSPISFYNLQADAYQPLGSDQGIACSSCHGPAEDHMRACREVPPGQAPDDLKILSFKKASPEQINTICASCHAITTPLTTKFSPEKPFFDQFDLKGLESPVFFPDGRSLGSSHIFTQWRMSPCAQKGQLQCLHCHTGGGAYRFDDPAKANDACMPCHKERVEHAAEHTHHSKKSPGSICISCHMPMIELKGIDQTDHSIRPPLPAATLAYKSPNACTLCHDKKDVSWADMQVRNWHKNDYQEPYLKSALLISAARSGDWSHLTEMLAYIENPKRDEMTAASLIRLLRNCKDTRKWPVFINSLKNDSSPLVRSAAAGSLTGSPMGETAAVLFSALNDKYALVRIRAVSIIALLSSQSLLPEYRPRFEKAFSEFTVMLSARPDDAQSYFNLGNLYLERRDTTRALAMYDYALKLEPDNTQAMINSAMAYYYLGQQPNAEKALRRALKTDPGNAQAHLKLGMLLMELKRTSEAEAAFRSALKIDPSSAAAYYNLAVMLVKEKPKNSLEWVRKAHAIDPDEPKYAYTYAYYLNQGGKPDLAVAVLKKMADKNVAHPETYALLADIFLKQKKTAEALKVYRSALENKNLSEDTRMGFMEQIQKLD